MASSLPARLRQALANGRAAGQDFPAVWPTAVTEALREAGNATERADWLAAFEGTRSSWQSAYAGSPATVPEWALHAVGSDPERTEPTGQPDPWERICGNCGGAIGPSKQANARYCSRQCQRAAHGRKVAA